MVIETPSIAAWTLAASVALHASLVVVVAAVPAKSPPAAVAAGSPIDVDPAEPVAAPPPASPIADESAPPQSVAVRAPSAARPRAQVSARAVPAAPSIADGPPSDAPVVVSAPEPARFVMAFGSEGAAPAPVLTSARGHEEDEATTFAESGVSTRARLLSGAPPEYPPAARAASVEADVPLEIVVDPEGQVVDARLLGHAGYGLDEAALRAVRGYRFVPAQRDGHGVRVRMRWTVDFRLD